jgi:hypothetical protein
MIYIICLILLFALILYCKRSFVENMADLTPEAVQNVASVYNKDNLTATNINATGSVKVGSSALISGGGDRLQVYKDNNGKAPYLYFNSAGNLGSWDGSASNWQINSDGNVDFAQNITKRGANLVLGDGQNKWIIHTPNDNRRSMWIARYDGNDWNWGNSVRLNGNGLCIGSTCVNETHLKMLNGDTYVSAKPMHNLGKCFDFGSSGRTDCGNGWSFVKLVPRGERWDEKQ